MVTQSLALEPFESSPDGRRLPGERTEPALIEVRGFRPEPMREVAVLRSREHTGVRVTASIPRML